LVRTEGVANLVAMANILLFDKPANSIPEIYLRQQQIHDGTLYYLHKGITFEERWQYLYRVKVE
jgi:hypothetical protein